MFTNYLGNGINMGIWELSRFSTSCGVIGIAGKLLENFKKNYEWSEIYSFADKRWSNYKFEMVYDQ